MLILARWGWKRIFVSGGKFARIENKHQKYIKFMNEMIKS